MRDWFAWRPVRQGCSRDPYESLPREIELGSLRAEKLGRLPGETVGTWVVPPAEVPLTETACRPPACHSRFSGVDFWSSPGLAVRSNQA